MVAVNKVFSNAQVVQALRGAAHETGADFDYLLRTAQRESSLKSDAKASTSSAAGLFQFIEQTWFDMVKKYGSEAGLSDFADKIAADSKGRHNVPHGTLREEILALRMDPKTASFMAGKLTQESENHLESSLEREVKPGELYIAHFLGAGGAARFIAAVENTPAQSAAEAFPKAAKANPNIFNHKNGEPRSLVQVYALLTQSHVPQPYEVASVPNIEAPPEETSPSLPTSSVIEVETKKGDEWVNLLRPTLNEMPTIRGHDASLKVASVFHNKDSGDVRNYIRNHPVPQHLPTQGVFSKIGLSPILLDVLTALQSGSIEKGNNEDKGDRI